MRSRRKFKVFSRLSHVKSVMTFVVWLTSLHFVLPVKPLKNLFMVCVALFLFLEAPSSENVENSPRPND
jgi:hypothetical protein